MPFSFTPEGVQQASGESSPDAVPQASFGSSKPANLMNRVSDESRSIIQILLFTILGLAVLLAIGMFGYNYYLSSQIESKKATLASYESRLANLPLQDMRKLSNRIKIINQLVKEHPSVNVAFKILEDSVEHEVVYRRFDLRYNESTKNYQLDLGGTASSYRSLAQQMDTYKRKPYTTYVPSITVDNVQPDIKGSVGFSLKMPITIAGLLPEALNLTEGAADRIGSALSPAEEDPAPASSATTTPSI